MDTRVGSSTGSRSVLNLLWSTQSTYPLKAETPTDIWHHSSPLALASISVVFLASSEVALPTKTLCISFGAPSAFSLASIHSL